MYTVFHSVKKSMAAMAASPVAVAGLLRASEG